MTFGIVVIVLIVIVVLWWLLTRNADLSTAEVKEDYPLEDSVDDTHNEQIQAEVSQVMEEVTTEEKEDDLKLIEGIGPKISSILAEAGITTFTALAEKSPEDLKTILTDAGLRLGDPATWPEQASLAATGDLEKLKELQESLTGGRAA